ncbi:flippase-like domain-containing protein [bacterium]|nr:flippase-like domain-containing protein [bacterium]
MKFPRAALDFLRKKPVSLTLSFAVTIVALWFALAGTDFRRTWESMRAMKPVWLAASLGVLVFGTYVRAFRWNIIMKRQGSTMMASLDAILISIFFNGVLPLRSGEVIRIGYFARRTGAGVPATTAALVLERALDMTALATIGAVALSVLAGRQAEAMAVPPSWLAAGAGAALVAMIGGGIFLKARAGRPVAEGHEPGPLTRILNDALKRLTVLESRVEAGSVIGLSFFSWLITLFPAYFVFLAAGMTPSVIDVAIILVFIVFAISLPSSPGFIGTFHAGFVFGAEMVGIPKETALPVAIVAHVFTQVPFILWGAWVLLKGGRKLIAKEQTD